MKLGIISDVHANLDALKITLEHFEINGVDEIIFLGDNVGYLHKSLDVVRLLTARKSKGVMGNHEAILTGALELPENRTKVYNLDSVRKCIEDPESSWISSLPHSMELELNSKKLIFYHGSPWNPLEEYIYPDSPKLKEFGAMKYDFIFLGHTHHQMVKKMEKVTVVNPGSVGLPRDGSNGACAVIYDSISSNVSCLKLPYDISSTLEDAKSAGVHESVIKKLQEGLFNDKK